MKRSKNHHNVRKWEVTVFCKIFAIIFVLQLKNKYLIEGLLPYATEVLVILASHAFLCQDQMDWLRILPSVPGSIEAGVGIGP